VTASDEATHHNYDVAYEPLFKPFRHRGIDFLEIGVEDGHSMLIHMDKILYKQKYKNHGIGVCKQG
jgi:hypothetical protein